MFVLLSSLSYIKRLESVSENASILLLFNKWSRLFIYLFIKLLIYCSRLLIQLPEKIIWQFPNRIPTVKCIILRFWAWTFHKHMYSPSKGTTFRSLRQAEVSLEGVGRGVYIFTSHHCASSKIQFIFNFESHIFTQTKQGFFLFSSSLVFLVDFCLLLTSTEDYFMAFVMHRCITIKIAVYSELNLNYT